jgi:hypothetical protein
LLRIQPLSRKDHERASDLTRHLDSRFLDASEFHQIACELLHGMQAQDVTVSLLEPHDANPSRMLNWTKLADTRVLEAAFAQIRPLTSILEAVRSSGSSPLSLASLTSRQAEDLRGSPGYQLFLSETGFADFALARLGRTPGESVGQITFYRAKVMPGFERERRQLLARLQPALSRAAGRITQKGARESGAEVALFDSNATPIWMSDGFRFLWNAVDDSRLTVGQRALVSLLGGGVFANRVGLRAVALKEGIGADFPLQRFRLPCRCGLCEIGAALTSVPGAQFGYPDCLLQVTLGPRNIPCPAEGEPPPF